MPSKAKVMSGLIFGAVLLATTCLVGGLLLGLGIVGIAIIAPIATIVPIVGLVLGYFYGNKMPLLNRLHSKADVTLTPTAQAQIDQTMADRLETKTGASIDEVTANSAPLTTSSPITLDNTRDSANTTIPPVLSASAITRPALPADLPNGIDPSLMIQSARPDVSMPIEGRRLEVTNTQASTRMPPDDKKQTVSGVEKIAGAVSSAISERLNDVPAVEKQKGK